MTDQTKRALERLPKDDLGGQWNQTLEQRYAKAELAARSTALLEMLDELCEVLYRHGLCDRERSAVKKAETLLRETTRAMLQK